MNGTELPWFRIRLSDGREIEVHSANAIEIFERDFKELALSLTKGLTVVKSEVQQQVLPIEPATKEQESEYIRRVCEDLETNPDSLAKVVRFSSVNNLSISPIIIKRPNEEDAVVVIAYLFQIGLGKQRIELGVFKNALTKGNGYAFPGRRLGETLKKLERTKPQIVFRLQTQKRNKPFALTSEGLSKARELIKQWVSK